MHDELARFVDSLAIPAERKPVVLAELIDHVESGGTLGDLEQLRAGFEAVEPAFATTRLAAIARGLVAAAGIALVIERTGGSALATVVGGLAALALAVLLAPTQALAMLRAELRAPRVIGPAVTYAYTVMSVPFLIWIALIVYRATTTPDYELEVPLSAFAVCAGGYALLVVEGLRARRRSLPA